MLLEFFRMLGLADRVTLHLNSIGDGKCRPAFRERLLTYLRERLSSLCEECRARVERNPLRVLDCKNPACQPVIERAPSILEALCGDCQSHFDQVRTALQALGIPYHLTPRMVRGLDYYVRTTFEVVTGELGAQNAVAGGGRYDGLVEALGGPSDSGIGFAIGMERVALLLAEAEPVASPLALLIPVGNAALQRLLPLAQTLRRQGLAVEVSYGSRKLRSELDRANRLKVPYAVILGDAELEKGQVQLREMARGTQRELALDLIPGELVRLEEARRRG
jgi:histidyl-tRNA synthetase